jgi:uncharacterized protein YigE (DUF2233 family)
MHPGTSAFRFLCALLGAAFLFHSSPAQAAAEVAPEVAPEVAAPDAVPTPVAPPTAQAFVVCSPRRRVSYGRTLVPLEFLSTALGASVGKSGRGYRVAFFGHQADFFPYQNGAVVNGTNITLQAAPQVLDGVLYVPWAPVAEMLGVGWRIVEEKDNASTFLLEYKAAFIESARSQVYADKVRLVLTLSNPTRIAATQTPKETTFRLAAARREGVPSLLNVGDYLVPRGTISSGNWRASFGFKINYSAPVQWYTIGFPARLVIDVQRLFEETTAKPLGGGLSLVKVRRGLADGPVQMFVVRVDPRDGWRMKLAPGGFGVLSRTRPSRIASRHRALVAVNGGFFSYDGAAVGAVLSGGEWIRLPWKGRTGLGFRPDGSARIANLQARATASFGDGSRIPVRDLNGWPDVGRVSALNRRFGNFYQLRAGEMALVVQDGVVKSKPGGGGVNIPADGFVLVASTGARPALERIERGARGKLSIEAPGWEGFTTALGGGPRLVSNGRVEVTALREAFRSDVRVGRAPRTAFGIDKYGRYILLVADGRQPFYSVGLTLGELAATMQKLGAVNALNLDGGGSTAMAIRSRVVNRPSDGSERAVSNALLVLRG